MPQRAASLAWGILGLVAVAGVILVGADAFRAAGRGPAWKRKLLSAGLVLMAAMGLSSCGKTETSGTALAGSSAQAPAGAALEETPEWKTVLDAWAFTSPLAESRRSTEAQRKVVEEKVAAVKAATDKLAAAGLITAAEAQLLQTEIANLRTMILRDPPTEPRVLCYDSVDLPPARESLERLAARLPLMKQLAEGGTVQSAVLAKILPAVEADIQRLADAKLVAKLTPEEQKQAEAVRAEAEARVKEIKALLAKPAATPGASLEETPEWKALTAAWAEAGKATAGERFDYPFDAAGKKALLDALAKADADLGKLRDAGLLGEPETAFLGSELAQLTQGVRMKRPTEMKMASCYDPMTLPTPAEQGLKNLEERLPLLEKMAEEKILNLGVSSLVFHTVNRDLAELAKPDAARSLSEADRARAAELSKAAEVVLPRIMKVRSPQTRCYNLQPVPERSLRDPAAERALLDRFTVSGALSADVAQKAREAMDSERPETAG
jgi:hypothetical protein